jgi:methionyl aminopeptidase
VEQTDFVRGHVVTLEGPIPLHTPLAFEKMRQAGCLASQVLDYVTPFVQPGVTTDRLNELCHAFICDHGAIPAPLNYRGFPKSICTSINHVVCHGIPDEQMLKEGDIVNIDVTVILGGWYGDTSRMFPVGRISPEAEKLIAITQQSLSDAINHVKPGVHLGDLGAIIQKIAHEAGLSVVADYCGHGIGQKFHCAPSVLHFGERGEGIKLEPGMFFTIEPMLNRGTAETHVLKDGWTVVTKDKGLSAQFEHTIGVTEAGYEIFTNS